MVSNVAAVRAFLAIGLVAMSCYQEAAVAATFLGLEHKEATEPQSDDPEGDNESAPPSEQSDDGSNMTRQESPSSPPQSPQSGDISISGGIGAQADAVSGRLTLGYSFSRYVGLDHTLSYQRDQGRREDEIWGEQYSIDIDLVLRYPNPTIMTPFVGVGPGATKWRRFLDGEVYDLDHAYTGHVFGGVNIRLARHFGLHAIRRQTTYWTDPPKSLAKPEEREAESAIVNQVGFHFIF